MRILIWATHLQTDILALALHLDSCPDVKLMVVTPNLQTYLGEPVAAVRPMRAVMLDRADPAMRDSTQSFAADVVVADNHLPPSGLAPRLFYMWHGLGWKARGKLDLGTFYRGVKRLTGIDPRQPNPAFQAQCYGPNDLRWRIDNWGLAPENCVQIGMTFSDMLLAPPYDRRALAPHYAIDILNRPTVLLSITWHYGGVFSNSGSVARTLGGLFGRKRVKATDLNFLEAVVETVRAREANLLLCLHDRKRYDTRFVELLEKIAERHAFVELRFKNERPDNLSDLLVADVMVSNLSSFLAYYYVLGRPAVHILPAAPEDMRIERRIMLASRFSVRLWSRADEAWMLDPNDVGGQIVRNSAEAVSAIEQALDDPEMGVSPTKRWLAYHSQEIDGRAGERFKEQLALLVATPVSAEYAPSTDVSGGFLDPASSKHL